LASQFESIVTGVAGHIGNYADAVAVADRFSRYPRLCRGVRSSVITHQPVFMLGVIPALVWPTFESRLKSPPRVRPPALLPNVNVLSTRRSLLTLARLQVAKSA
jgi:hypothetical protein